MYATTNEVFAGYTVPELIKLADAYLNRAEDAARIGRNGEAVEMTKLAADVRKTITARRVPAEMQKSW